ncbi:unnamed protein product [Brassica oleracea]
MFFLDEKITSPLLEFNYVFSPRRLCLWFYLLSKSYGVCVSDYVTLLLFRHRPPYVHLGRQSQILMSCKFQLLHDDLFLDLRKESFTYEGFFNFQTKVMTVGNSVESCKDESKPQNCFE